MKATLTTLILTGATLKVKKEQSKYTLNPVRAAQTLLKDCV